MPNQYDEREVYYATILTNPKVRAAVRGHLEDLEWSSHFAEQIAEYFRTLSDGMTYEATVLHAHLLHEFMPPEINHVLGECLKHKRVYEADRQGTDSSALLTQFQRFYNRKVTTKLIREHQADPERLVEEIEKLQKMKFASIPLDNLGELDVDKVIEEDLGNIQYLPTSFKFIEKSCYPNKGYSTGQVVMVCAPPGNGKTNFLAHEVVAMLRANEGIEKEEDKFRIYWIALGDMNRLDFIVRLTAIYKKITFNEVKDNPKAHFTQDVKDFFKYVKISVVPASYVDIYGVKHFVENTVVDPTFDPQVVIIDYDANLQSNRDSMYMAGEETYNVASRISRPMGKPGRLVFVASQPKIEFWNYCPMPMEAAAESSRKQAIIDMMITIARDPNSIRETTVGKMMVAKNRRGTDGGIGLYQLIGGLFWTIEDNEYAASLQSSSSGNNNGARRNNGGKSGGYHSGGKRWSS